MARTVLVNGGQVRYTQKISVGHHLLQADEPVEAVALMLVLILMSCY